MPSSILPTTEVKDKYRIKNWSSYNASLCNRGNIRLWISSDLLELWSKVDISKKTVGEQTYAAGIISCCLLLRINYNLKFRQTTGFVESLLSLMGMGHLSIPDYTTLCRRQKDLPVEISNRLEKGEQLDIAIDSTGLKVYGEGEWKVRKHGVSKRRTWMKFHVAIDVNTQEIVMAELTTNAEDDAAVGAKMLAGKSKSIRSFRGDGGYDGFGFRKVLGTEVEQIIPPPTNAVIQKGTKKKPLPAYLEQRNKAVIWMKEHGRKEWKTKQGYHKRSLNEVTMFRYKTIFGGSLSARKIENQSTEMKLKCSILNKFTHLGMPVSYKVA